MNSIEETISDMDYFPARAVEVPKLDKLSAAFVAQAQISNDVTKSLAINSGIGVIIAILILDSAATVGTKADQEADTNEAKNETGEHESCRTKLSTTFTSV